MPGHTEPEKLKNKRKKKSAKRVSRNTHRGRKKTIKPIRGGGLGLPPERLQRRKGPTFE